MHLQKWEGADRLLSEEAKQDIFYNLHFNFLTELPIKNEM